MLWRSCATKLSRQYAFVRGTTSLRWQTPTPRWLSSSSSSTSSENNKKERFPLPDRDKELALAKIQTTIFDHYQRGDFRRALAASQTLVTQSQQHFGELHPATASAYNNVGLMHKLLGDFGPAKTHYDKARRIYGKVVGRDHTSYAMTLHNLATLHKAQVHLDPSLTAVQRLDLVEKALAWLEEAWEIRLAELGTEHPHTVATQSTYGSTLADRVLYQHRHVVASTSTVSSQPQQQQYISLSPKTVTDEGWDAAEQHLRQALQTAMENPRGKKQASKTKRSPNSKKKQQQQHTSLSIDTLSAASAAQNLAVVLKARAMTQATDAPSTQRLEEAKTLYQEAQRVRLALLPRQHPDLYATQYSLAELLQVLGDTEAANALRQEILDTYDPVEGSSDNESEEDVNGDDRAHVVIEQHSAATSKSL